MQALRKVGLLTMVLLASLTGAASALTIADPDIGGEYSLSVASLGSGSWLATVTIDLDPLALEIPATTINQIDFKVANAYSAISVTDAPDAAGNWIPTDGPLMGTGCKGSNDSFVCLNATTPLDLGSTTFFSWQVQFDSAALLPEQDWHIGVRYTSPSHPNGWVVSLSAPPIPEPASGLLFAAGMLIVGASARRRSA